MRLRAATLSAAVILGLFLTVVPLPTADAATTRVLAITGATAQPTVAWKTFDSTPPKVFDFNGDGQVEIIVQNDNQWVYVFDSENGKMLAELTTKFPVSWGARSFNGPEAAVLQSGGAPRLIVMNSAAYVTSFRFDATASTLTKFVLVKEWERRLNVCHSDPGSDSKPVFADLDKDGTFEILASTEENGLYALRADGTIYWHTPCNTPIGGNAEPAVADLNLDGWPDVVFGGDNGVIAAFRGRPSTCGTNAGPPPCTSWMWGYNVRAAFGLVSGSMPIGVGIGQIDGVGGPDIVAGARDSHDPDNFANNHALLVAVSSSGQLIWGRQDPQGAPLTYTHPVIVDTDNNGENEIYWADWNTIGHKGGIAPEDSWAVTGPAHFYRYDRHGNMVWRQTMSTWWNNKDVPLADVDGDGIQEMLANGPGANGHDGIWYLNTVTGAKETFVDAYPWKVARAPVLFEAPNGRMKWVLEAGQHDPSAGGPAILVYDTGVPYNSAWPHVPYPTIGGTTPPPPPPPPPVSPPPPPPPIASPPPPGFNPEFTSVAGNNWWQEVIVNADRPLAGVDVRVNCGATWSSMTFHPEWGNKWTASKNAPTGSKVDFRARATDGSMAISGGYTWPSASPTTPCSPPPPPPPPVPPPPPPVSPPPPPPPPPNGTYAPDFTSVSGNAWWQEVIVISDRPLAGVDVRVNCGVTWTAMTFHPEWGGKWTAGKNAPSGSKVDFRARATDGSQAISGGYTWTSATPTTPCGA